MDFEFLIEMPLWEWCEIVPVAVSEADRIFRSIKTKK